MYNNLLDLRYKCLFIINLKYIYYIISLYKNNYYYFTFIISKID